MLVTHCLGIGPSVTTRAGRPWYEDGPGAVVRSACTPSAITLCLQNGRFQVELDWKDFDGNSGSGRELLSSEDSALFYFFNETNWEMLVKVLNGCGVNERYWVFSAATARSQGPSG